MSQKQKENLLLIKEIRLAARIISTYIDAFLSILRNESSYELTKRFEIANLPDWQSFYQIKIPKNKEPNESDQELKKPAEIIFFSYFGIWGLIN